MCIRPADDYETAICLILIGYRVPKEIEADKMDRSQILNTFDVAKRIGERADGRRWRHTG